LADTLLEIILMVLNIMRRVVAPYSFENA